MTNQIYLYLFVSIATFLTACNAQDARQDPKLANLRVGNKKADDGCQGGTDALAKKVEVCAKPLMDIVQGSLAVWPQEDKDIENLCTAFHGSERCIRDASRKCAKGIHKTVLTTVANSIQRARKRECKQEKYAGFLRTTKCIDEAQKEVQALISNATSRMNVVEHQVKDLDEKTNKICCIVYEIEDNFKLTFIDRCPAETSSIVNIYRSVLQDAIELVCRSPKCNDIFKGYKVVQKNDYKSIISSLLRIVFSLGS